MRLPVILGVLLTAACTARAGDAHVATYDLHAKGLKVGRVVTTRSRVTDGGRSAQRTEVTTAVDVNLLVYRYRLSSREVFLSDDRGVYALDVEREEDGVREVARGRLEEGAFRLTLTETGAVRTLSFPRGDYDCCSLDAPELALQPGQSVTRRVLSVGSYTLLDRTYACLREERVTAGGRSYPCRVVDFTDALKSGRRWYLADEFGFCIVRQDGRDKAGAYSLRLVRAETRPAAP